jgi:hypothetical protein
MFTLGLLFAQVAIAIAVFEVLDAYKMRRAQEEVGMYDDPARFTE